MDGGAWWAAVHGVADGWTRLRDFTFTFHFHALEKEMATQSSVLAWRIPGTGEPGGLPSVGLYRVGHDWSASAAAALGVEFLSLLVFLWSRLMTQISLNFPAFSRYIWVCLGPWGRALSTVTALLEVPTPAPLSTWTLPSHTHSRAAAVRSCPQGWLASSPHSRASSSQGHTYYRAKGAQRTLFHVEAVAFKIDTWGQAGVARGGVADKASLVLSRDGVDQWVSRSQRSPQGAGPHHTRNSTISDGQKVRTDSQCDNTHIEKCLTSHTAAAAAESLQLCPTLCDPIDGSSPGSPVPGTLQARTLEWVAVAFSNACKWKVKVNSLSRVRPSATPWTAAHQAPLSMRFSRQEYWSGVPLPSPDEA